MVSSHMKKGKAEMLYWLRFASKVKEKSSTEND